MLEEELDWLSQLNKFNETGRVIELDDEVADTAVNEGSMIQLQVLVQGLEMMK